MLCCCYVVMCCMLLLLFVCLFVFVVVVLFVFSPNNRTSLGLRQAINTKLSHNTKSYKCTCLFICLSYFSGFTSHCYVYKVLYFSSSSIFFLSSSFLFSILLDFTRIVWTSWCELSVRSWSCNTTVACSPMLVCDLDSLFGAERLIRRNRLRDWVLRSCWSFPCWSPGTFK